MPHNLILVWETAKSSGWKYR